MGEWKYIISGVNRVRARVGEYDYKYNTNLLEYRNIHNIVSFHIIKKQKYIIFIESHHTFLFVLNFYWFRSDKNIFSGP